tara:strand:- start:3664 stop:4119 length:456 start_codon:yes stop_codon:yes gene_type:complete
MNLNFKNKTIFFSIAILLFIIDQYSKTLINVNYINLANKDFIIFTLENVRNNGAAFNILSGNRLLLSLISLISSFIFIYFIFIKDTNVLNKYGLSFILAGSLGNGSDRIISGEVIDFIKLKFINFPVFNLADIFINIGIFIIILGYLKYKK